MSEKDQTVQAAGQEASPETAAPQPVDWQAKAAELEARVKGLQTALNEKHSRIMSLENALAGVTKEAQEKDERLRGALESSSSLEKRIAELTGELTAAREDAARSARGLARFEALAQHPQLFAEIPVLLGNPAEGRPGLLPENLEGDALKSWLSTYAERLGAVQKRAVEQTISGATPPGGSDRPSPTVTKKQLIAQIAEAISSGNRELAEQLQKQLPHITQ